MDELARARAEAARFKYLLDESPNLVFINRMGRVVYANRRCMELTGYTADELTAPDFDFMTLVAPESRSVVQHAYARHRRGEEVEPYEYVVIDRRGERVEAVNATRLIEFEGEPAILGIMTDISARKRIERELRASERRYRQLVETSPDPIVYADIDGGLQTVNAAAAAMLGYGSPEQMVEALESVWDLVTPAGRRALQTSAGSTELAGELRTEFLRRDGSSFPVEVCAAPVLDADGKPVGTIGIARDVTARLAAERALRESEERHRTVIETCPDAIVATNLDGEVVMANRAAARLRGFDSVVALTRDGGTTLESIVPEHRERAARALERARTEGRVERFECHVLDAAGARAIPVELTASVLCDADGHPTGFVTVLRDLTERRAAEQERRRLEAQVQHAQRLESLGVLAGGIAHDFNNLLVGVLGNAGLAIGQVPPDSEARRSIEQVTAAAQRAAALVEQMLTYAGRGAVTRQTVRIPGLVREIAHLLEAALPKGIRFEFDFADDAPAVSGDVGQLQQVAMNLITNAAEAIAGGEGTVRIRVHVVGVECAAYTPGVAIAAPAVDHEYLRLTVEDDGAGMDDATRDRIFEPFFTTKFTGRGLGLAAVIGIVRGHDGGLVVDTEVGRGTTFHVLLPTSSALDLEAAVNDTPGAPAAEGTVLVVDDEELVRTLAARALAHDGFTVLTAADGLEALELVRAHRIDVVVLDLTMPRVSGAQALEGIHELRPGLPVVLSSGYTERDATEQVGGRGVAAFVQKPYLPEHLVATVNRVLAGG